MWPKCYLGLKWNLFWLLHLPFILARGTYVDYLCAILSVLIDIYWAPYFFNYLCDFLITSDYKNKYRCQFHQNFTYKFFVQMWIWQLFSSYVSSYVFTLAKNSYKKCARIMLMKLTAGNPSYLRFSNSHQSRKSLRYRWKKYTLLWVM